MKHGNEIIKFFLLAILAFGGLACQTTPDGNKQNAPAVKAQSPTNAYKLLYAAVKAKDVATVKQLMSKSSLGLAEFSASQQKKSVDAVLENGLVAPTLAPAITEIRDERVKDNFGRIEVRNEKENRWEDLPFIIEDGGWKLAVGDIFAGTFDPQQTLPKGKGQNELGMPSGAMPTNAVPPKMPGTNANGSSRNPVADEPKSIEVPKEKKP